MSPEKRFLVQNYMTPNPVTVDPDATLRQVVEKMIATNTYALIVVDQEQRVTGIVSLIDVMKEIIPDYLEEDRHVLAFEAGEKFAERIHEHATTPIKNFMTARVVTIKANHTMIEAATLLTEHRIHQLPVVDEQGRLVGYIGRTKVRQAIGDVFLSQKQ